MSRNLKKDYLKKLYHLRTTNGFKIDLANYMYNPSYEHEYPHLIKAIEQDENTATIHAFYYFKHYNGNGEYIYKTYNAPISADGSWYIAREAQEKILESSNRFNLNKLIQYAEAF